MLQDIRKCFAVVAALVIALFLLFSTNAFAQIYTWHTKAAMPTARFGLASGAVNGIVYAVGGVAGGCSALSALEAYDPATNTWTTKASMPTARYHLSVGVVNGILYAIGGGNNCGGVYGTVEAYDPVANTWTKSSTMPTPRISLAASVLNGKLYAVGGSPIGVGGSSAATEAYDPASDTWSVQAAMLTARTELGSASANGLLYAVGGSNGGPLNVLEAFTPKVLAYVANAGARSISVIDTATNAVVATVLVGGFL